MVIVNTTFHVDCRVSREFVAWLKNTYTASAPEELTSPQISRVMGGDDPDGISYAHQMTAPTLAAAKRWHDGEAAQLRALCPRLFGGKTVFFTTYLDVIP